MPILMCSISVTIYEIFATNQIKCHPLDVENEGQGKKDVLEPFDSTGNV